MPNSYSSSTFLAKRVAICVAMFLALCFSLGTVNPVVSQPSTAEVLGPVAGELVSEYQVRSAESFASGRPEGKRWALVSLAEELMPQEAIALLSGLRVSQIVVRVPLDRVQTPLITIAVPGSSESILQVLAEAARFTPITGFSPRSVAVNNVTRNRLEVGCACIAAVVVRANFSALQALRIAPRVRIVEVLPEDALGSRIGVSPLLSEHRTVVLPQPDDGLVPEN
ncbi:MAG: hypothetical protein ACRCSF_12375 [Mycobacteriaceae bacterium]